MVRQMMSKRNYPSSYSSFAIFGVRPEIFPYPLCDSKVAFGDRLEISSYPFWGARDLRAPTSSAE